MVAIAGRNPEPTYSVQLPDGDRRMQELIVYISDKCQADPTFGATKLNKILFYADFLSFVQHGHPVTGEEYQVLDQGPAPRQMVPVRNSMVEAGDIVVRSRIHFGRRQIRTISLRDADLSIFSGIDIAIVDHVIEQFWGKSAAEVSNISHGPWWKACHDRESIPYEYAYLSDAPITVADIERTRELADKYRWME